MSHAVLVLLASLIFLLSCGESYEDKDYGDSGPVVVDLSFKEIQPILERSCQPCHGDAAFLKSGEAFKASKARAKLKAREMPKSPSPEADEFKDSDREKLLAYLD